ncbi:hypothetical protein TNCV_70851 [Trichonephila clavipes]|nr:hypothetical protein TNCV_70851 [Trichonephila clavipes]
MEGGTCPWARFAYWSLSSRGLLFSVNMGTPVRLSGLEYIEKEAVSIRNIEGHRQGLHMCRGPGPQQVPALWRNVLIWRGMSSQESSSSIDRG